MCGSAVGPDRSLLPWLIPSPTNFSLTDCTSRVISDIVWLCGLALVPGVLVWLEFRGSTAGKRDFARALVLRLVLSDLAKGGWDMSSWGIRGGLGLWD
jgi:hypothetical protein